MPTRDEIVAVPAMAFILALTGLILSITANFYCGYATNTVTFTEQVDGANVSSNPTKLRTGIWSFEDHDLYYLVGNNEIFYVQYSYCVPWNAQTKVEKDINWNASQAFTIISGILGGFMVFVTCTMLCSNTGTTSKKTAYFSAVAYMLIVLCQGLTFLFFASKACNNGSAIATHGSQEFQLEWDSCTRSYGANCSIASIVFYFVASLMLFSSTVVRGEGTSYGKMGSRNSNAADMSPGVAGGPSPSTGGDHGAAASSSQGRGYRKRDEEEPPQSQ